MASSIPDSVAAPASTSDSSPFRFLLLPAEIRQQVYVYYFTGTSVTFENHAKASDIFHKRHPFWFHVGSQINLLLTCRQIHGEAHELVYEYDTVNLHGEDGLGQFVQACTLDRRKHIKHVINASTYTYRYRKYLTYLPHLQTLHIQHRSTYYTVATGTSFADDATFSSIMMAVIAAGLDTQAVLQLRENANANVNTNLSATNNQPKTNSKTRNRNKVSPWLRFIIDVPIYYDSVIDPVTLHDYGFGYKFPNLDTSHSSGSGGGGGQRSETDTRTEYEGKHGESGHRVRICVPCTLDVLAQTVVKHFDRTFVVETLPPSYRSIMGEQSSLAEEEWEMYVDDVRALEARYARFLGYSGGADAVRAKRKDLKLRSDKRVTGRRSGKAKQAADDSN